MQNIEIDEINYVVPSVPMQLRAVCSKEAGHFLDRLGVKTKELVLSLVTFRFTVQTFPPHYVNERFIEVWGFPLPENGTTCLTTFLIHRESIDRFLDAVSVAEVEMVKQKTKNFNHLLKFSFLKKTGKFGDYFVVSTELLPPDNEEAESLLEHSGEFDQLCHNPRLNRSPVLESVETKVLPSATDEDTPF